MYAVSADKQLLTERNGSSVFSRLSSPLANPGFLSGGVQQIRSRTEDRENGDGGSSLLFKGSGGSCNLVQEISFHKVNFS